METVYLEITGKVQGVFFRAKAKEIAELYKISGWIMNTQDGKVVATITGENNAVEKFIQWCKHGPEKAQVKNVLVNYTVVKEFDSFEVKRF